MVRPDVVTVGTTVFVYSPFTLLGFEPPTRQVPCDWVVRVDHDTMWLAVGFEEHLYFCTGHSHQCVPRFSGSRSRA